MITDNLFLYKNFKNGEILKNVLKVYDAINTEQKALSEDEIKKLISSIVNSLFWFVKNKILPTTPIIKTNKNNIFLLFFIFHLL